MRISTFILFAGGLLASCGQPEAKLQKKGNLTGGSSQLTPEQIEQNLLGHFQFDSTVSSDAKTVIQSDLKALAAWEDDSRPDAFEKLEGLAGLDAVSAETLSEWLMDRVTYFYPATGENFNIAVVKSSIKKIFPLAVPGAPANGIVAANMGPQVYEAYRVNKDSGADGILLTLNGKSVDFLGLRTGLVFLGSAFANPAGASEGLRTANSIFRLSALFHEARHSDGNVAADTLGMLHAACPGDGSVPVEYAGLLACDQMANGPYHIGAQFMEVLMGLCDSVCSDSEKAQLEAVRLDYISRILVPLDETHYVDAEAEPDLAKIDSSTFQTVNP